VKQDSLKISQKLLKQESKKKAVLLHKQEEECEIRYTSGSDKAKAGQFFFRLSQAMIKVKVKTWHMLSRILYDTLERNSLSYGTEYMICSEFFAEVKAKFPSVNAT
jgi:hypothetical protein